MMPPIALARCSGCGQELRLTREGWASDAPVDPMYCPGSESGGIHEPEQP